MAANQGQVKEDLSHYQKPIMAEACQTKKVHRMSDRTYVLISAIGNICFPCRIVKIEVCFNSTRK
jgi:hypothetical protein